MEEIRGNHVSPFQGLNGLQRVFPSLLIRLMLKSREVELLLFRHLNAPPGDVSGYFYLRFASIKKPST